MNQIEQAQAEIAAAHAERVALKLEEKGALEGVFVLRAFAASLRAGAHLSPPGTEVEANRRTLSVVQDLFRQKG
jgi:hypothetical protein